MLTMEMDKEDAMRYAIRQVYDQQWNGPIQVVFLRQDGVVEVWGEDMLTASESCKEHL